MLQAINIECNVSSSCRCRVLAEMLHVITDRCTAFMADVGVGPVIFKIVKLLLPFPVPAAFRHTETSLLSTGCGAAATSTADNCAALRMLLYNARHQGAVGLLELSSIWAACPPPESPHVDGVPQIGPWFNIHRMKTPMHMT